MSHAVAVAQRLENPESPGRGFIREGFCSDRQNAYLFDSDGTLRSPDGVPYDRITHSVKHLMGQELSLQGFSVVGSTDTEVCAATLEDLLRGTATSEKSNA